uniref:FBA_2 domain-containing protein n=1 Tax=Caenorhabditis tropicalis TaxID=1561998 RepID=A0A1I7UWD4_9PELO
MNVFWYFEDVTEAKDPKEFRKRYSVDGVDFPTKTRNRIDQPNDPLVGNVSLYDSSKLKPGYRQYRETFNVANDRPKGKQYHTVTYTPTTMSASPLPKCWTPNICSDYQSAIIHFVNFIKEVFKCDVTGFRMDIRSVPNFGKFFTKNVINGTCKTFELNGMRQKETNPLKLDAYDIDWVLTNTPSNVKLKISCEEIVGNFRWEEPITQKAIEFNCDSTWFTAANLLNSKCNTLETGRTQLNSSTFREFITKWINGTNKEFRYLCIQISTNQAENMRKSLFGSKDYDVKAFDRERKFSDFELNPISKRIEWGKEHFEKSRDIRREDGMTATITVLDSMFLFVVWHKKNSQK